MSGDVIVNKIETIGRCIRRVREEYANDAKHLNDYTKQDSMMLNLQRACEACIDLAMHIVSEQNLGVPQSSRDAFDLLRKHQIIDGALSVRLKAMVGFRHIAVHDYQANQVAILQSIIENHLDDFIHFTETVKRL